MSLHTSIARGHGEFPSPIGESYFSISLMRIKILCEQFPSPIGESYFSIIAVLTTKQKRKMPVSVPYRGILFFNKPQKITGNRKTVSVPYRGILFFNGRKANERNDKRVSVPYRGILFFNEIGSYLKVIHKTVSVPYRGILFFNGIEVSWDGEWWNEFPSPIGESYFSIRRSYDI